MSSKKKPTSALMSALMVADKSGSAKGLLPPSTCKQQSTAMVTCTAPALGITGAVFQTYPSLTALYAAYTAKVQSLNSGKFQTNFLGCGVTDIYGEASWNHMFAHSSSYSIAQMITGKVTDAQAVGRVFCVFNNGQESFVWTQDDGHLMGYVAGPVHEDVWHWWVGVHHNIGLGGKPMHM